MTEGHKIGDRLGPACPECAQSKHVNCTGWSFTEDDEFCPCGCETCIQGAAQ